MSKKRSKLKEYSKKAIAAIIVLWFLVALFGMGVIVYQLLHSYSPEAVSLGDLFNYVGIPMTGGTVAYLLKSATENKQKIKNNVNSENVIENIEKG